jgi:transcriptional regulator GlxA family with amidase domain
MKRQSDRSKPTKKKKVVIVAMSGNIMINFSGPADVFSNADRYLSEAGLEGGYDVEVVSPTATKKVQTSYGLELHCRSCATQVQGPIDTLIVAGNKLSELEGRDFAPFLEWLCSMNESRVRRLASVCGGVFALAKAGLLDGRKVTTHWDLSERLKRTYPKINVDTNAFFTSDGYIYTAGGVSSGIDLALALVEEDHGKDIAIRVARKLVFYLRRPGFQAQFGNLLPLYESTNIAEKLKGWFSEHLHEPMDIERIATHLNMSTRNFTRVFHKQTGISPAKFVEKLRVETARRYLEDTEISIERISEQCGLGGLVSMRRTFLRHLDVTPSDYRRAFKTSLQSMEVHNHMLPN